MKNAAVQTDSIRMTSVMGDQSKQSGISANGDPFMMIFQNMMANAKNTGTESLQGMNSLLSRQALQGGNANSLDFMLGQGTAALLGNELSQGDVNPLLIKMMAQAGMNAPTGKEVSPEEISALLSKLMEQEDTPIDKESLQEEISDLLGKKMSSDEFTALFGNGLSQEEINSVLSKLANEEEIADENLVESFVGMMYASNKNQPDNPQQPQIAEMNIIATQTTVVSKEVINLTNLHQLTAKAVETVQTDGRAYTAEGKKVPGKSDMPIVEMSYKEGKPTEAPQNSKTQEIFTAQRQFYNAVDTAKRQLQQQSQEPTKDTEIDIDQLQRDVTMQKTPLPEGITQKPESVVQPPRLVDQLSTGISQKLGTGEREFTIKLNPESLGEITIKLVESEGKTTVTISTANAETARLINKDLSALRDTMGAMQVEVKEAVTQASETPQGQMQQQSSNMSGQQFAEQRQAFAEQNNEALSYEEIANAIEESEETEATLEEDGLNVYI